MITAETYFNKENELEYFSSSQFRAFCKCEAAALAEIKGEYEREKTTSLLVGSFIDAYFEGTLNKFKSENPELFTKQGELKSNYKQAEEIIRRLEKDKLFMEYMGGEKQVIITGQWLGYNWKTKIDSYLPGHAIVDLKVMKDFEPVWVEGLGKMHFIEAWGYDIQGAIYQAIEGHKLPFIIAAATKEKVPDIKLFGVPQYKLDVAANMIKMQIDRFADIKAGLVEPIRCEHCDYCKQTRVLSEITPYDMEEQYE